MEQTWKALLVLSAAILNVVAEGQWGYDYGDGPSTWPEHYKGCGGNLQSPISLTFFDSLKSCNCRFTFKDYSKPIDTTFTNNGHTVNLALQYPSSSPSPRAIVEGCERSGTYRPVNMHFHWPSEHVINGRRFDLELHMVHSNENKQNLVLGVLFQSCWQPETRLNKLASVLDKLRNVNDSVPITGFSPDSVLPSGGGFYVYEGSLTTPPCTENVLWLVYNRPVCVSEETLKEFYKEVRKEKNEPMTGNYRPLQERNGRKVCYVSQPI